jgi:excisionase family DNA binding protein
MSTISQEQQLFSIEEAAQLLGCSPWTLRRHVTETGAVKSIKLGRLRKIHRKEIERVTLAGLPSLKGPGASR